MPDIDFKALLAERIKQLQEVKYRKFSAEELDVESASRRDSMFFAVGETWGLQSFFAACFGVDELNRMKRVCRAETGQVSDSAEGAPR